MVRERDNNQTRMQQQKQTYRRLSSGSHGHIHGCRHGDANHGDGDGDDDVEEVVEYIHHHGRYHGSTAVVVVMVCMGGDGIRGKIGGDEDDDDMVATQMVEVGSTSCCDDKQHDGAPPHDNQPRGLNYWCGDTLRDGAWTMSKVVVVAWTSCLGEEHVAPMLMEVVLVAARLRGFDDGWRTCSGCCCFPSEPGPLTMSLLVVVSWSPPCMEVGHVVPMLMQVVLEVERLQWLLWVVVARP